MNGCGAGSNGRLLLERLEHRLDGALRAEEAALDDASDAPALVRQLPSGRQVHVRDLEQRHALVADVHVVPRGLDEAVQERRPQHALLRRQRAPGSSSAAGSGSSGRSEYVYTSKKPLPTSTSATRRRSRWSRVSRPKVSCRSGSVVGTSSRRKRTTSSTTSISRRDVPRAPRRDPSRPSRRRRRIRAVRAGRAGPPRRTASPRPAPPRSGREPHERPLRKVAADVRVARPARARELDDELGRQRRGLLREVRVDALHPPVRALGAAAAAARCSARRRTARSSPPPAGPSPSPLRPRSPRRP